MRNAAFAVATAHYPELAEAFARLHDEDIVPVASPVDGLGLRETFLRRCGESEMEDAGRRSGWQP